MLQDVIPLMGITRQKASVKGLLLLLQVRQAGGAHQWPLGYAGLLDSNHY